MDLVFFVVTPMVFNNAITNNRKLQLKTDILARYLCMAFVDEAYYAR